MSKYIPKSLEKPYIRFITHMDMEVEMSVKVPSVSSSSSTTILQKTFEKAILCFIFGPPEQEAKALKKVKEIIDFALKCKLLGESDSDD